MRLGAGRVHKGDPIDHATGVVCLVKVGDAVDQGEPLAEIHARDASSADAAVADVAACYRLVDHAVARPPLVLEVMGRPPGA